MPANQKYSIPKVVPSLINFYSAQGCASVGDDWCANVLKIRILGGGVTYE